MDAEDKTSEERLLAVLALYPANVDALIGLAKLGARVHHTAPVVIRSIGAVSHPLFRAICMDVLAAILEDVEGDEARAAVAFLAKAIEDPAYRRMRRKIAQTLFKIGFAARDAIPAMARTLRSRIRDSVRVPLQRTLIGLVWLCWEHESADVQRYVYKVLEGFSRSYQVWILGTLLKDKGGSHIRDEAQRLRDELSRTMTAS